MDCYSCCEEMEYAKTLLFNTITVTFAPNCP